MPTGADLVHAISINDHLTGISDCGGVPAYVSKAIYQDMQDDNGGSKVCSGDETNLKRQIRQAVKIPLELNRAWTYALHFQTSPGTHHFLAIPWFDGGRRPRWVYTILMAYVNAYDLGAYIAGQGNSPKLPPVGGGYQLRWTEEELVIMLFELLSCGGTAWAKYFGNVEKRNAKQIEYWRYPLIPIDTAIRNVQNYVLVDA